MKKKIHQSQINPSRVALPVTSGGSGEITRDKTVEALSLISKTAYGVPGGAARLGADGYLVQSQTPAQALALGPRLLITEPLPRGIWNKVQILGADMNTPLTFSSATVQHVFDKENMVIELFFEDSITHDYVFCGKTGKVQGYDGKPSIPEIYNIWRDEGSSRNISVSPYGYIGIFKDIDCLEVAGFDSYDDQTPYIIQRGPDFSSGREGVVSLPADFQYEILRFRFKDVSGIYGDWSHFYSYDEANIFKQNFEFPGEEVANVTFSPNDNYVVVFLDPDTNRRAVVYKRIDGPGIYREIASYNLPSSGQLASYGHPVIDNSGRVYVIGNSGGRPVVPIHVYSVQENGSVKIETEYSGVTASPVGYSTFCRIPFISTDSKTLVTVSWDSGNKLIAVIMDLETKEIKISVSNFALPLAIYPSSCGISLDKTQIHVHFRTGQILQMMNSGTVLSVTGGIGNAGGAGQPFFNVAQPGEIISNVLFNQQGYFYKCGNSSNGWIGGYFYKTDGSGFITLGSQTITMNGNLASFGESGFVSRTSRTYGGIGSSSRGKSLIVLENGNTLNTSASAVNSIKRLIDLRAIVGIAPANLPQHVVTAGSKYISVFCTEKVNDSVVKSYVSFTKMQREKKYSLNQQLIKTASTKKYASFPTALPKTAQSPDGNTFVYGEPLMDASNTYYIGRAIIFERMNEGSPWVKVMEITGTALPVNVSQTLGIGVGFSGNDNILIFSRDSSLGGTKANCLAEVVTKKNGVWTRTNTLKNINVPMNVQRGNVGHLHASNRNGSFIVGPFVGTYGVDQSSGLMDFIIFKPTEISQTVGDPEPFKITGRVVSVTAPPTFTPQVGGSGDVDDNMRWLVLGDHGSGVIWLFDLENPLNPPKELMSIAGFNPEPGLQQTKVCISGDGRTISAAFSRPMVSDVNAPAGGYLVTMVNDNGVISKASLTKGQHHLTKPTMVESSACTYLCMNRSGSILVYPDREGLVVMEKGDDDIFTQIDKIIVSPNADMVSGIPIIIENTGDIIEMFRGASVTGVAISSNKELSCYKNR